MATKIYGIDLGTTYSCIAHIDNYKQPVVIKNFEGEDTTPSVVYFESPDCKVVGETAKSEAWMSPELVVQTVKRHMGQADWDFEAHGETYDPITISSFIIKKIVEDASAQVGEPITDAVITVPAYFGAVERSATQQAGKVAGLTVHSIISEPTAAALFYDMDMEDDSAVMVYDLGGGTFDIAILQLDGQRCTVVATGGNHQLGGVDWDAVLTDLLAQEVADQAGVSVDQVQDRVETMNEIMNAVEGMKKKLTSRESAQVNIGFGDGANHARYTAKVTREAFDHASEHLLEQTIGLTKTVLQQAEEAGVETVDTILLVGGSTRMPQVRERLSSEFSISQKLFDPDLAVAKGAAKFALKVQADNWLEDWVKQWVEDYDASRPAHEQLDHETQTKAVEALAEEHGISVTSLGALVEKQVTNVTPKSFGVVVSGVDASDPDKEFVVNMIRHNAPVPADFIRQFGTRFDNQTAVRVACVENLRDEGPDDPPFEYEEHDKIGEAVLELDGTLPANSPLIITLGYTQDGRITLRAEEPESGKAIDAEFRAEGLMSEEELSRAKERVNKTALRG